MPPFNKITLITLVVSYLALASVCVYGQGKTEQSYTRHKPSNITLGFRSGGELLFNSSPLLHSRRDKVHYAISSTLVLRKPINAHFKFESGLRYSVIQNSLSNLDNSVGN